MPVTTIAANATTASTDASLGDLIDLMDLQAEQAKNLCEMLYAFLSSASDIPSELVEASEGMAHVTDVISERITSIIEKAHKLGELAQQGGAR
jgi:hypothetical protein